MRRLLPAIGSPLARFWSMLTNDASNLSSVDPEERRRALLERATHRDRPGGREPGTLESFEAIYALWRSTCETERERFMQTCGGQRILKVGCGIAIDGTVIVSAATTMDSITACGHS